jgi:hypothetical protein
MTSPPYPPLVVWPGVLPGLLFHFHQHIACRFQRLLGAHLRIGVRFGGSSRWVNTAKASPRIYLYKCTNLDLTQCSNRHTLMASSTDDFSSISSFGGLAGRLARPPFFSPAIRPEPRNGLTLTSSRLIPFTQLGFLLPRIANHPIVSVVPRTLLLGPIKRAEGAVQC